MRTLDLAPAIAAIRARPEEFVLFRDTLHHRSSSHSFQFVSEDEMRIDTVCDCALLRAAPEQARAFHAAFREWRDGYWRGVEINRAFAGHFSPPPLWRRLAIRLLQHLLSRPSVDSREAPGLHAQDKPMTI